MPAGIRHGNLSYTAGDSLPRLERRRPRSPPTHGKPAATHLFIKPNTKNCTTLHTERTIRVCSPRKILFFWYTSAELRTVQCRSWPRLPRACVQDFRIGDKSVAVTEVEVAYLKEVITACLVCSKYGPGLICVGKATPDSIFIFCIALGAFAPNGSIALSVFCGGSFFAAAEFVPDVTAVTLWDSSTISG